ncbi:hypothetical protein EWF20_06800 [Sulfolobus sp. S-194]|uniref:hypothetical protein n=1 Tax=Sulfolobus sp. S-194 TaxID=2512240 RepID=UPI001436DBB9|nr:hypothetical protein [Sulfolobus sp. S-194]QIW23886.1 hypothetical protein EWF20_06800 [Sulfolobus sp. S-194]
MNKPLLLGLSLAILAVSGLVIAAQMYGTLATISYNVINNNSNNQQIQIIPINFNLGNITSGQSGSLNGSTTVSIPSNGTYDLELKEDVLDNVFSQFIATITIGNHTIILQLHENNDYKIYLTAGKYTVIVKITYTVSQNPETKEVSNTPFLLLKYEQDNDSDS